MQQKALQWNTQHISVFYFQQLYTNFLIESLFISSKTHGGGCFFPKKRRWHHSQPHFPECSSRVEFHVLFFLVGFLSCCSVSHVRETVVAWNGVCVPSIETSVGSPKTPWSLQQGISFFTFSHHGGTNWHLNYLLVYYKLLISWRMIRVSFFSWSLVYLFYISNFWPKIRWRIALVVHLCPESIARNDWLKNFSLYSV